MEHNDAHSTRSADPEQLERRTDALGQHIEEARNARERAVPDAELPFAVGDFNADSSDAPDGEGVTPETNYTTRGD